MPDMLEGMGKDGGAKLLAEWMGYKWEGLYDGRLDPQYKPFGHNQMGWYFQGHKQDVQDIVDKITATALAAKDEEIAELKQKLKAAVEFAKADWERNTHD